MIVLIVIVIVIIKSPMMSSQMPQMTRQCGHSDPRTLPESSMGPPRARPGHPLAPGEGPGGGCPLMSGGPPPPSSLPGSSGHLFVTSVRSQNRHCFCGLFWEHSASAPDWPRCSGACKYGGQLDVDHVAPGTARGHSQTVFGLPTGPAESSFRAPEETQSAAPERDDAKGRQVASDPVARVTGSH